MNLTECAARAARAACTPGAARAAQRGGPPPPPPSLWPGVQSGTKTRSLKEILTLSVRVECVLRLCETSKNHWYNNVLEHPGKLIKIPYKTCRLLILFRSFSQNDSEKYQKSIRFFSKSGVRFTPSRNIKKPLVKQRFGASGKVDQNTL